MKKEQLQRMPARPLNPKKVMRKLQKTHLRRVAESTEELGRLAHGTLLVEGHAQYRDMSAHKALLEWKARERSLKELKAARLAYIAELEAVGWCGQSYRLAGWNDLNAEEQAEWTNVWQLIPADDLYMPVVAYAEEFWLRQSAKLNSQLVAAEKEMT